MSELNQHTTWYSAGFEAFEKSLNGESKSPVHQLRRSALLEFSRLGFPTTKNEEWRYTNIASIAKTNFSAFPKSALPLLKSTDIQHFLEGDASAHLLVFVNGYFIQELSNVGKLPKGVKIENLATVLKNNSVEVNKYLGGIASFANNEFNALNTAFLNDGVYIRLEDKAILEEPVTCLYLSTDDQTPFAVHPRNLIVAGKTSKVTIIERYAGLGKNVYLTNSLTEVFLAEQAKVEHTKLQLESESAYHISSIHVHQQKESNYTSNSIALGGSITRNNIISKLDGEYIECTLNGLSLGTRTQLIDNHTTIDHAKPNCVSHELYKAILDGQSKGVFNGKIFVRKDAQKTDAKQTNKALLLSDDATIDTKPQLEIFADDVKCTHGATVGQLDENQIFYLRTRGFGRELARDVLTTAFANSVVDKITIQSLREHLYELIFQKLHEGRAIAE